MDLVDVIVPIYNCEKYLDKTIYSVLNQTYKNIHLILVNDCSLDNSAEICKSFSKKDKRITFIDKENNTGVSDTRNVGLKHVKGDYVLFLDGDDWIDEKTIEVCVNKFSNNNIDLIFFNYVREFCGKSIKINVSKYNNSKILTEKETQKYLLRRMFGLNDNELKNPNYCDRFLPVCMKMYKTKIIRDNKLKFVGLETIGTAEDGLFNIEYLINCKKTFFLNEYYYHYRRDNNESITRNIDYDIYKKWNNLYDYMRKYMKTEFEESFNNRIVISIIGYGMCVEKSTLSYKNKIKKLKNFIYDKNYINSINKIKLKNFSLKWRVFFFFVKYKCFFMMSLMLKIMNYLARK